VFSTDTREERLAQRFAERRSLSVPIDVLALANSLAIVSEKIFPIDIDGLCLDLKKPGIKPTVWVSKNLRHERKRFTLAHEIGHIVIPWHSGIILDEIDVSPGRTTSNYFEWEGEANRFAAELLMPSLWADDICRRASHMRDAMHVIAQRAEVSLQAAALRVLKLGPPGYLVAATRSGMIEWTGRTKGTRSAPPREGNHIAHAEMPACETPEELCYNQITYVWWKEKGTIKPPRQPPADHWKVILADMLGLVPDSKRKQLQGQVNAIVGYAIGKEPKGAPVDAIYARTVQSLQNRSAPDPHLNMLLNHPRFDDYVLSRVFERAEAAP
jgi:Zn-dependent peptidase ImmA (M78 family)